MSKAIIKGNYADPFVYRDNDDYYLVATKENALTGEGGSDGVFEIFHSTDLKNWSCAKVILDFKRDVSWAKGQAWAPTIIKHNGYWYFVFCADSQIGVAVCDTFDGNYRDVLGKPLIEAQFMGIRSIDPSIIKDDDGKIYLLWGSGKGFMREIFLSPEDVHFVGDIINISDEFYGQRSENPWLGEKPGIFCEGMDVVKYKGQYILTFSIYDFRDYRYNIRYAFADKITGPYIQPLSDKTDNLLIKKKGRVTGTGHGNIVPFGDGLYLIYHRRVLCGNTYLREICCDKVKLKGKLLSVTACEK